IEDLKAQLEGNLKVATRSSVKTKVLAPGMYAIDVKPIPHPLKNNRSAHLNYINHLKESVETVREIVEEARVVKPLDNALNYACQYTKLSQELLEYMIGTCPKSFNERDNKAPSTPVTRKKQVTFNDKPGTSSSNTQKHKVHQKVQQTNVHVIHSTGVNTSTEASGSKPRSNTKKNRILPAKSENKKKVEDHPRTNKLLWTKVNQVDSSISSKRVVINSNSESVCKTCNKCLNSANHEMCVVNILSSVNATPTVKIVLNKGKQIWKPKGKLSDNSLNKTKRVWKATGKLFADIGYQWRPTGNKFTLGKLNCGYQWRPTGKKFALSELCLLTKLSVKCCSKHMTGNRSKLKNFVEKFIGTVRFGNDHFGAIMGYGDYVIGDSVISRVYYVEGLGHNLFSVGQFCDSNLEIAFRKHSCFVRDMNGVDLLKGSRITNLYTISIDDMMKSSPPELYNSSDYFVALCNLTNDSKDLGNFQAKADFGIFVGYAPSRKGYRIYNKRTRRLMETIHVTFDEMHQTMAPVRISSGPEPIMMTHGQLNSGLAPSPVPATTYIPPTDKDLEILFQPMFDEYFDQSTDSEPVPTATVVNAPIVSINTSVSTTIAQDAPSTSHLLSSSQVHPLVFPQGVAAGPTIEDTLITQADLHPLVNPVAGEPSSAQSTSGDVSLAEPNQVNQPPDHLRKWTKDHPLDNIVAFSEWEFLKKSLGSQPEGFRPKTYTRLSSEEGSLWAKAGTKGVMTETADVKFKKVSREVVIFLEIDWLAGHQRAKKHAITTTEANHCHVWMLCSILDAITLKDNGFDFNNIPLETKDLGTKIFRALTASADVPSSVTETTDTTSTLPPPPPPLQKPIGHRDIWEKVKDQKSRMHH
ncbi:hypothetical protein Tco_0157257, partial [Tanacetum coccineum]